MTAAVLCASLHNPSHRKRRWLIRSARRVAGSLERLTPCSPRWSIMDHWHGAAPYQSQGISAPAEVTHEVSKKWRGVWRGCGRRSGPQSRERTEGPESYPQAVAGVAVRCNTRCRWVVLNGPEVGRPDGRAGWPLGKVWSQFKSRFILSTSVPGQSTLNFKLPPQRGLAAVRLVLEMTAWVVRLTVYDAAVKAI